MSWKFLERIGRFRNVLERLKNKNWKCYRTFWKVLERFGNNLEDSRMLKNALESLERLKNVLERFERFGNVLENSTTFKKV